MKPKSKVLIIAGSDSSGGAGIQADIKSVTVLGSYAMTALTAVTAQNTKGVKNIISVPVKNLQKQIILVIDDILGLTDLKMKFVKKFVDVKKLIAYGAKKFKKEVKSKKYPSQKHSY